LEQVENEHRISAGAIVIQDDRVLLVRYNDRDGKSFLVGPGGRVENNEGINQAVIREVREETGLEVNPSKILFVEDLLWRQFRMVKIWFLCNIIGGKLYRTPGAAEEGIIEAGWYSKDQLHDEVVYPAPLLIRDWRSFFKDNQETEYLEIKEADF
jgi:8-oxo-dGTP diphosphatase